MISKEIITDQKLRFNIEVPSNILDHSVKHHRIRLLKNKINEDPRNSIARIDIAREYTVLGEYEKAYKNILIALALNKENRFILRSSARFLVHIGKADLANHILHQIAKSTEDPWLLAAEIATSSVLSAPSKLYKLGIKVLDSNKYRQHHLSELAAALATQEYNFGNLKKAKKFFKAARISPTENAVAQIIWAYNKLGLEPNEFKDLQTSRLYEARARENFSKGNWAVAVNEGIRWFNDQPFSRIPAQFISYLASSILEDYTKAIRICEISLEANPKDFTLLNNISFALASQNQPSEAEKYFNRINELSLDNEQKIIYNATKGLIQFRYKDINKGHFYYNKAIEIADKNKFEVYSILASIYFLKEQTIVGVTTDLSIELLKNRLLKILPASHHPEVLKIIDNIKKHKSLNGKSLTFH
jgi:tetratricopeptide (TPR) repeat protein